MKIKRFMALAVLTGAAIGAQAQELNLAGDASGLFNGSSTTYEGLLYVGSTFDVLTSSGFYALGGDPGTPNVDNLGSFSLSTSAFDYNSPPATFILDVFFTKPTGILGGGSTTFTADLVGQVINSNTGGVLIEFGSAPQMFTFSNSHQSGTFSLAVDSLSLYPGQTASLTGYGIANIQSVPEPGAVACMALGLIGTAFKRRWRR